MNKKAFPHASNNNKVRYFNHTADYGIEVEGESIEEIFEEGAKALFNLMVDITQISPIQEVSIECEAESVSDLFVKWLNELLFQKDVTNLLFSQFKILEINRKDHNYKLIGKAYGEFINLNKHLLKLEVKAATHCGLRLWKVHEKYHIRLIVDV
jgi:SHS2 domain-containing protein